MSSLNTPAEYIQLAFMIERSFPGYVDAYFGPPELKDTALSGDEPTLDALQELAGSLTQSISIDTNLNVERRAFLAEEVRAMRTTIQILKGNSPPIVDEVELLYGVRPIWIDEHVFEEAHHTLDEILPGSGPLPDRVQHFHDRSRVPVELAISIAHEVMEDFRQRTRRLFDLPAEENCEILMVRDKPWRAYNWYLGAGKSRIDINQDSPLEVWDIPITVAHEAYPGHHTEHSIKETRLYRQAGWLEHSIALSNNPSALISEGIATNALSAIVSQDELQAMLIDCYARAGLSKSDALSALAFREASNRLRSVVDNQVLLLYRDHAPDSDIINYGMRYALTSEAEEVRTLRFFKDPLSRSYVYNYTLGHDLIAAFLDRSTDKRQAFQRLLSEPLTPTQIRQFIERN